jgi:O-antigen/teichoic acid export membrane protein
MIHDPRGPSTLNAEVLPPSDESLKPGGRQPAGAAAGLRTDSLLDGVLILVVFSVVQRGAGFVRAILFCRWLDPGQLGQWDMAFAFLMLAGPLAVLSLPGTFGRYVEYYRQRGQFRAFLRRTALGCAALGVLSVALICLARRWFSHLVFGTPNQPELAVLLGIGLLAVIAYNYLISLFMALRNMRLASGMELANSLAFAVLGIGLLLGWKCSAGSVVTAYGGACLLCSLGSCWWLRQAWRASPQTAAPPAAAAVWDKLLPFAAWVLLSNLLSNLFTVADRCLIVHCTPGTPAEALALVGHYHSSRVVPLLLASIAGMLGTMILPHLSHDWEAGRREQVSARLSLFLKLLALALTAVSAAVLLAAPLLFNVAFQGKYAQGLAVLPWTLVYCVWLGAAMVAQQYLWCAERASLVSLALLAGLLVSVAMNILLLPRLGLLGAVLATSAANLVTLALILSFNRRLGFRVDRGLWIVLAAPLSLCLGPWIALLVLAAVALEGLHSDRLLSQAEKRRLAAGCAEYLGRIRNLRLGGREVGQAFQPDETVESGWKA